MGSQTAIQWCDDTFNPWVGCSKVHTGCLNCYAEADFDKRKHFAQWGPHGTRVKTTKEYWRKPYNWNAAAEAIGIRARVFCASLADVFEDWTGLVTNSKGEVLYDVGDGLYRPAADVNRRAFPGFDPENIEYKVTLDDLRLNLFWTIDNTPNLDWLLLTKRPENIINKWIPVPEMRPILLETSSSYRFMTEEMRPEVFRRNVWLGTSVSDLRTAEDAVPELLNCRHLSPVLFLSVEPLVERIGTIPFLSRLDWVIVGGESGVGARPCHTDWIYAIVRQCKAAGVPCFVKQLGSHPVGFGVDRLQDKAGGNMNEWPEELRVRQFPIVAV